MHNAAVYREAVSSLSPNPQWRANTLTAMRAAEGAPARRFRPVPLLAACAAAVVLLVVGWQLLPRAHTTPTVSTLSQNPGYTTAPTLPKLTISPPGESMGGYGDDVGLLIVRSPEEQRSKNPTLDNTDGITALPVYSNAPPLERQRVEVGVRTRGDSLEERLVQLYEAVGHLGGLTHPTLETTRTYNVNGQVNTWFTWFEDDPSKSITDRLLDYSFARLGDGFYVDEFDGVFTYCTLPAWPAEAGVLYPIRTAAEAEADFRAGNYLGADVPTDTENAQILYVELVYFSQPYQTYIQPVYKLTYTQDYWDAGRVMAASDPGVGYTSVSFAYVPAVAAEYVEAADTQYRFN